MYIKNPRSFLQIKRKKLPEVENARGTQTPSKILLHMCAAEMGTCHNSSKLNTIHVQKTNLYFGNIYFSDLYHILLQ